MPLLKGQQLNATVTAQSRLQTPEQFDSILLRTNAQGGNVYLRDVARPVLMLAGGTGLAPFLAMLDKPCPPETDR